MMHGNQFQKDWFVKSSNRSKMIKKKKKTDTKRNKNYTNHFYTQIKYLMELLNIFSIEKSDLKISNEANEIVIFIFQILVIYLIPSYPCDKLDFFKTDITHILQNIHIVSAVIYGVFLILMGRNIISSHNVTKIHGFALNLKIMK